MFLTRRFGYSYWVRDSGGFLFNIVVLMLVFGKFRLSSVVGNFWLSFVSGVSRSGMGDFVELNMEISMSEFKRLENLDEVWMRLVVRWK